MHRIAPVVVAVAAGLTACGDDDNDQSGERDAAAKPRVVRIELTESGFKVPKEVPGGVVRIEFTNSASGEHAAQLGYADEGHTGREALEEAGAWVERGAPLPDWAHAAGGPGETPPGETVSVTQELPPGSYFVLDTNSEDQVAAFFTVTAPRGRAEVPQAAAEIEMSEYAFRSTGLAAGPSQVLVRNTGAEPHFVEAVPLKAGKTIADVRRFLKKEEGPPPVDFDRVEGTTVIDGGMSHVVPLDFEAGEYALLCFVPDRAGGPPHAFKGMVSAATVR